MKLIIDRFKDIPDGTIGKFYIVGDDGVKLMTGFSLEPAGPDTTERNKDRRVPAGIYNLDWYKSGRTGKTQPVIYNDKVPMDRYIAIHQGNCPKDTEGCILLGDSYDSKGIYNSVKTLSFAFQLLKGNKVVVEIRNIGN